jgi:hypothetical protein
MVAALAAVAKTRTATSIDKMPACSRPRKTKPETRDISIFLSKNPKRCNYTGAQNAESDLRFYSLYSTLDALFSILKSSTGLKSR